MDHSIKAAKKIMGYIRLLGEFQSVITVERLNDVAYLCDLLRSSILSLTKSWGSTDQFEDKRSPTAKTPAAADT